ncbi:hypothetical protein C8J57DRAFT_1514223 [Mycena rebaudengoi]|nr:hypothetical protein C8J57DRAFT_1514223 [Mycena rebaudengoi]
MRPTPLIPRLPFALRFRRRAATGSNATRVRTRSSVTCMLLLPPSPLPDSTGSCYSRRHARTGSNPSELRIPSIPSAPSPVARLRPFPASSKQSSTSSSAPPSRCSHH